jgi:hypothetical protein
MAERPDIEAKARSLHERISRLGQDRDLETILQLVGDPDNRSLLESGPESSRTRAEAYVKEAERWAERKRDTNTRRMGEARRALDGLDLELARGLMNKIDGRFLSEDEAQERDQLLIDIAARTMEFESISETGDRLLQRTEETEERPWWRRWFG